MDFDAIKSAMDEESKKEGVDSQLVLTKKSRMPLDRIRKKMRGEIITQLLCIVVFFAAAFVPMSELTKAVYVNFIFVTCLITLGYLFRMTKFLKVSGRMVGSTKDVLQSILSDLNLTIEVYKTAIIAGSLLLPVSAFAFICGSEGHDDLFAKFFLMQAN